MSILEMWYIPKLASDKSVTGVTGATVVSAENSNAQIRLVCTVQRLTSIMEQASKKNITGELESTAFTLDTGYCISSS